MRAWAAYDSTASGYVFKEKINAGNVGKLIKKLSFEELKTFRDRLELPITDERMTRFWIDMDGAIRLVLLDYLIALAAMVVVGALALADLLPGPLLLLIALIGSLTSILSHVGLRSLFPILVPEHLWERVNAVDSNGYVVVGGGTMAVMRRTSLPVMG